MKSDKVLDNANRDCLTNRPSEPRHPMIVAGAIRELAEQLTRNNSFGCARLEQLCAELEQSLTIQQFENSIVLTSHPEKAAPVSGETRPSSGSTVRNERQRATRSGKGVNAVDWFRGSSFNGGSR